MKKSDQMSMERYKKFKRLVEAECTPLDGFIEICQDFIQDDIMNFYVHYMAIQLMVRINMDFSLYVSKDTFNEMIN